MNEKTAEQEFVDTFLHEVCGIAMLGKFHDEERGGKQEKIAHMMDAPEKAKAFLVRLYRHLNPLPKPPPIVSPPPPAAYRPLPPGPPPAAPVNTQQRRT